MAERRRRPVIGLTPDMGETEPRPARPAVPRYELKQAYADAVIAAGGLPVVLPYDSDPDRATESLSLCDALVVTGGAFDVPADTYGARGHHKMGPLKPARTRFEQLVLRAALSERKPVLGICGGMQLLAVEVGGTLWQDIREDMPDALDHEQKVDPRLPGHAARIVQRTRLAQIVACDLVQVNSTHHQAVRDAGAAVVSAVAPDGIIEAIELPDRFALGVQWHPELMAGDEHLALYEALVDAARTATH